MEDYKRLIKNRPAGDASVSKKRGKEKVKEDFGLILGLKTM